MENEYKRFGFKENKKEFLEYKISLKTKEDILQTIKLIPYHLELPDDKLNYFKNLDNLDLSLSFCFIEIEKVQEIEK